MDDGTRDERTKDEGANPKAEPTDCGLMVLLYCDIVWGFVDVLSHLCYPSMLLMELPDES